MAVLPRLLAFLKPYRRRTALALCCLIISGLLVLFSPLVIGWAIDYGVGEEGDLGSRTTLILAGFGVLGFALARAVSGFVQQYMGEWLSQRVAYDIRNAIYDRLQRLSYAYHDKVQVGQLMSRATADVESVRLFVNFGLLRGVYTVLLLLSVFIAMLVIDWRLGLISFAFIAVVGWRSMLTTMRLRPLWLQIQEDQAQIATVLEESLSGIRVVKAFSREEHEAEKFGVRANQLFDDSYAAGLAMARYQPVMNGIWMLSLVVTLWYGGWQIDQGSLQPGELTSFLLWLTLLQMPVRMVGWMVMVTARAQSSGERILEIIDAESAVQEKPDATELRDPEGLVRFEGVAFGYDAVAPVLRGIDIEARPGQVVALLGPTGSGKSTVVNLLPRFYDVTGGRITIDGIDIRDLTLTSLRQNIGAVQQEVFLFSDTIRENIRYGRVDATDAEIEQAARAARIHDHIAGLPDSYDTWVGERGVTLSGGQKQRIAIARTILLDPRILVFDDSTSSVDTETEYLIQQALGDLMQGRTTFVIAQRLRTVKRADQILVLRDGRIVERGTHAELLDLGGLYREIYDLELRAQEEALPALVSAAGA
jgi:ATP-binding cassette subfamily B protein